jgi:hypothetical protein
MSTNLYALTVTVTQLFIEHMTQIGRFGRLERMPMYIGWQYAVELEVITGGGQIIDTIYVYGKWHSYYLTPCQVIHEVRLQNTPQGLESPSFVQCSCSSSRESEPFYIFFLSRGGWRMDGAQYSRCRRGYFSEFRQ